jgi:hypothetical protein
MAKDKSDQWIKECWDHYSGIVSELDVAVDWGDWNTERNKCWCCGHESRLQRCHVVPKSLGGSDAAANIVPLCAQCHDKAPDVIDPSEMFRWIAKQQNPVSGLGLGRYWHLYDVIADFAQQLSRPVDWPLLHKCIAKTYEQASYHCSQFNAGPKFKKSTREWIMQAAFDLYSSQVL